MIGIYKITNKINNHSYVGQSRNISKRWHDHIYHSKNIDRYPLYRAFDKYGINNFSFEIIEECSVEELNAKEQYWIKYYQPEYNQTFDENYNPHGFKLSYEQAKEIQDILIADQAGQVSHKDLAIKYGVSKDTIRDINVGRSWKNDKLSYPLHNSKYTGLQEKQKNYCIDCGIEIHKDSIRCNSCNRKNIHNNIVKPITREELKILIRSVPFTQIGKKYNVTDNTIRKWCDFYSLPRKVSEIKKYSDEEWEKI